MHKKTIDYKKCICGGNFTTANQSEHDKTMEHIKFNQYLLCRPKIKNEFYEEKINKFEVEKQRDLRVIYGDW